MSTDPALAEGPQLTGYYVSIPNTAAIRSVDPDGIPRFVDPAINDLFANAGVRGFRQAFPGSRLQYMRDIYIFNTAAADLGEGMLHFPQVFGGITPNYRPEATTDYFPNDFPIPAQWPVSTAYLSYIGAPQAWGITKGDPNVIIGITDTYFDVANPDLANKIERLGFNDPPTWAPSYDEEWNHGTLVAGLAGAATDNNEGYASMGFNCRLDLAQDRDYGQVVEMSSRGDRVLNASWVEPTNITQTLVLDGASFEGESACVEIYENGAFFVAGAGNGGSLPGAADLFRYPAAYDHVMSVSSEGWQGTYGVDVWNVQGVHEGTIGNSVANCYQNNSRVDILAPALQVGGLYYDPTDPSLHYTWSNGWGTSFASPLVTGTAALMVAENSCLSPYQIEYLLKQSADESILSYPENQPYAGELGSGGLRAGIALSYTENGKNDPNGIFGCNNTETQTFYIEGVEVSSVCSPGYASNGVNPKFTPVLKNGMEPYSYRWDAIFGNSTTLDANDIAEPTVVSSNGAGFPAADMAYYRLTVYDGSPVQKVATRIVRVILRTSGAELALRDSYMDMFDEPNDMKTVDGRDWDIWHSPDVWNRQQQDGVMEHQNPEYFQHRPNYVYARVRNIGCEASQAARLHLHWTKASTGENWSSDWDGTTQVAASNGGLVPGGGEITSSSGLVVPAMDPGDVQVVNMPWNPPQPQTFYGSPVTVDVCLLARLFDASFLSEQSGNEKRNVINSNNIVTRNLIVMDLDPFNRGHAAHQVDVSNAEASTKAFMLQLINDKAINKHFAGDLSAVASIELDLGALYERWVAGGQQGNVTSFDRERHTVQFDGTGKLELRNIWMDPHERFPITCTVTLREGASLGSNTFNVHLRQFLQEDVDRASEAPEGPGRDPDVYGDVSFLLRTTPGREKDVEQLAQGLEVIGSLNVYPNPANDRLNVHYIGSDLKSEVVLLDITGRVVLTQGAVEIGAKPFSLDVSGLAAGEYLLKATAPNGTPLTKKLTIRH